MTRMTVGEIQDINLEILRHIDAFCKNREIRYFLDSGTLLGAARNGGFIPWDDDADIAMPRPDYERFLKEYRDSDGYRLYSPSRGNCFLPYSRLCDMKRTYFKQESLWTREEPGVGVDILPIDGAPDTAEEFDRLVERICRPRAKLFWIRYCISPISAIKFRHSPYGFAKDVVHWLGRWWHRRMFGFYLRKSMRAIRKIRLENDYENSTMCHYIVVTADRRKYWRKEWFDETVELEICGEKFPAPRGYDERLSAEYGDWRTPPPSSERGGHEVDQTMFWRDRQ